MQSILLIKTVNPMMLLQFLSKQRFVPTRLPACADRWGTWDPGNVSFDKNCKEWGFAVTINYRVMLGLAGLFMVLLAIATLVQGYFEHSYVVVAFQFVASALLLYWALF